MHLLIFLRKIRYVSIFFVLLVVFFTNPRSTFAGGIVWDPGNNIPNVSSAFSDGSIAVKEYGLDSAAYFVINSIIKKIAAQTVNWINSGFQGSPAYVTDPGRFFLEVGDEQASKFLSNTNLANLCSPFKAKIRITLVKNYLNETDNQVYSCTLSKLKDNYEGFINDFDEGGWDGWIEVTQNTQNNPYGAYSDAKNKFDLTIGTQKTKYEKQLEWGSGFLSFERCPEGQDYIDPATGKKDCFGVKETVTPGSVIENQLNGVLGSGVRRLEAADEINEIIGALLQQLTSTVVGGIGKGLRGASEGGNNSFIGQLRNEVDEKNKPVDKYVTCDANGNCDQTPQPPTQPPAGGGDAVGDALDRLCARSRALCDAGE